jgi:hypothetical protein
VLHLTTRQDIQVHRVLLEHIPAALVELNDAGLPTQGGGGNAVRNIMSCPDAGVCAREAFDVAPYCVALTEFLLADPLSFQLPRKYKIAFSGCARDCSGARINDLGFIAKRSESALGFAVYIAGGMGAHARVGDLFEEFIPQGEAHLVAEAVKRVFDRHGNRKNRQRRGCGSCWSRSAWSASGNFTKWRWIACGRLLRWPGCLCEIFPGANGPFPRLPHRRMVGSTAGAQGTSFPRNRAASTSFTSRCRWATFPRARWRNWRRQSRSMARG